MTNSFVYLFRTPMISGEDALQQTVNGKDMIYAECGTFKAVNINL